MIAGRLAGRGELDRPVAQRQPDEVGLRVRHVRHDLAQRRLDPLPLGHDERGAAAPSRPRRQGGQRGRLGHARGRERGDHLADGGGHRRLGRRGSRPAARPVPTPWTGCAARPRSGGRRTWPARPARRGSVTNSRYASSSTTRTSAGTASRNASSSARRTAVPVGLFGLQTRTSRVRSVIARGHRGQVVPVLGRVRHPDAGRAGGGRDDRVRLERAPGVDDLVAVVAGRPGQVLGERDRAAPGGDPVRIARPSRSASVVRAARTTPMSG